jgi:hypothetical protein
MGGYCLEGHITDPRNKRIEEMNRRQRRMEVFSGDGQGPEAAVVPWIEWNPSALPYAFVACMMWYPLCQSCITLRLQVDCRKFEYYEYFQQV